MFIWCFLDKRKHQEQGIDCQPMLFFFLWGRLWRTVKKVFGRVAAQVCGQWSPNATRLDYRCAKLGGNSALPPFTFRWVHFHSYVMLQSVCPCDETHLFCFFPCAQGSRSWRRAQRAFREKVTPEMQLGWAGTDSIVFRPLMRSLGLGAHGPSSAH